MISTYFHEWKEFYKAFIVKTGDIVPELTKIPNFKEARKRTSNDTIYLFGISEKEYKQGRQTQREEIEGKLQKIWLDEDLVLSDILTDWDINRLLSIRDHNDN